MKLQAVNVLMPLLLAAGAAGEESSDAASQSLRPLKLQVVFSQYQAGKQVASLPYTLSLNADDAPARLRIGVLVPVTAPEKDAPGKVSYDNVGSAMDCSAKILDAGRFKVTCTLERSSLYSAEGERRTPSGDTWQTPPLFRTFRSDAGLVLRDGETAHYVEASDPLSGEVLKIDVTLHVVK